MPGDRIIELDWNDSVTVGRAAVHRHRGPALLRPRLLAATRPCGARGSSPARRRKVFYTGDTGYFPGFADIGEEHGPFDVTLIQIGAYSPYWPDIHMTPEEAVATHLDLRGGLLVPVHWATFNLALHSWGEPVDRIWREAKAHDVQLAVPRPGERVNVDDPAEVDGWWQQLGAGSR